MKFLVFGAGAIGTYIGGSLALAGNRVTFIEQGNVVNELRKRGLRLELIKSEVRRQKAEISSFILPPSSVLPGASSGSDGWPRASNPRHHRNARPTSSG